MSRFDTLLDPAVKAAITGILGGQAEPLANIPAWHSAAVIAAVGFSGPTVVGSLGVSSTLAGLADSHPLSGQMSLDEAQQMDWAGELANQLFGIVKRELANHGVITWPSTPVVMRGVELRVRPNRGGLARSYGVSGSEAVVWLEFHTPESLDFEVDDTDAVESVEAGSLLLF